MSTGDGRARVGDFQWPVLRDRASSRYLKHFMFSFKNIYSENCNSANLMFITGPTKSGKSVFLRQNLNEFASKGQHVSQNKRVSIEFDCFLFPLCNRDQ